MIISASRRTDIPAFYSNWFLNRLNDGYVYTRNPMNPHRVSRIALTEETIDGIVFWTKNPAPILDCLDQIRFPFYFQFTLTAYSRDLEPGLPSKQQLLLPAFQELSRQFGSERVVWRYDPIILSPVYTVSYHLSHFAYLAKQLSGFTDTCVISFFDVYRHLKPAISIHGLRAPSQTEILQLAEELSKTARAYGIRLNTCSEAVDLSMFGIGHSSCIDAERLSRISGIPLHASMDPNQREHCGCAPSVDIGMYQSCAHGCTYCYANHSSKQLQINLSNHHPDSPLLYGQLHPEDLISDRNLPSLKQTQLSIWE